jgi:hypothetical protein
MGGSLRAGYARATWEGRGESAHVVVWLMAGREIPEGLSLDHTCHDPRLCAGGPTCPHRACVNIDHLRLADAFEQAANSTATYRDACAKGHPWPENRAVGSNGKAYCRVCLAEYLRRPDVRARNRAKVARYKAKKQTRDW